MDQHIILGTAGHIDHGKSALVQALTGTDPDRLKEEKERGITIDLGFADLSYDDGLNVGIIDVPGHERLIKNMLAGAGGIDMVLMVIAADEGIMPQSREHLDICNLLRVKKGLIALTKSDLVDSEWIELVKQEIEPFVQGTFLEGADIIEVSAKTGHNIDLLKEKIKSLSASVESKSDSAIFRLPVDRIFTLKGFGTVVTGTALSGSISVDDPVEILPKGLTTRVRGLQSHGKDIRKALAGQRVAINLQGVSKDDIRRGDVISIPEKLKTTYFIDADLEMLKNAPISRLKNRSLVHFHTGTTELTGRIIMYDKDELRPGDRVFCQYRFKEPLTIMAGDRYIIRRFSPLMTIGGGEILDVSPKRRKKDDRLKDLEMFEQGDLQDKLLTKILQSGLNGLTPTEISGWIKVEIPSLQSAVQKLVNKDKVKMLGDRLIHGETYRNFVSRVGEYLEDFHRSNPLKPGMTKEALKSLFRGVDPRILETLIAGLVQIEINKDIVRLKTFSISLTDDNKLVKEKILDVLDKAAFQPPSRDELAKAVSIKSQEAGELLKIMATEKSLVRINDSIYIPSEKYKVMMDGLQSFFSSKPEMTVGEFRDLLGTSRKYALPFLEHLDSNKITLRVGEVRKLLKKSG